jgi:hypothetical protein
MCVMYNVLWWNSLLLKKNNWETSIKISAVFMECHSWQKHNWWLGKKSYSFGNVKTKLRALPCSVHPVTAVRPKMLQCVDAVMYCEDRYTESSRNSELIRNTNSILLWVINEKLQHVTIYCCAYICFTLFVYSVLWVVTTLLNAQMHMNWEAARNV